MGTLGVGIVDEVAISSSRLCAVGGGGGELVVVVGIVGDGGWSSVEGRAR